MPRCYAQARTLAKPGAEPELPPAYGRVSLAGFLDGSRRAPGVFTPMIGRICISGIRFHAFHGLTRLERQVGVRHRVDLAMTTNILPSAKGDRIEDTIDYREVHDVVVRVGRQNSFHLIETLAVKISREILEKFPSCAQVETTVTKETPVVDGMVDTVGVEITITREDLEKLSS